MAKDEEKTIAMLSHLLGIFSGFIGALVLYIIYSEKGKSQFVKENAKNALNFQLSMLLYYIVLFIVMLVTLIILIGFLLIPVFWILGIFALIVEIIGCVKSYGGEIYRYPLTIHFIK